MIFDSTSKHHAVNMKLLLVVLGCIAVSALPVEKQKRDILPGDPRYGTDHHHHHENVIEDARSSLPSNSYGPPGYQPGVPLNHLEQHSDVTHFSTPLPNFDVSNNVQLPQLSNSYIPVNTETKKTVTTVNVPVQHTKTVSVGPPATSYGTPVVHHTKTSVDTSSGHVETTHKTVKTEVHDQQVVDLPTPSVKVIQQTPVTQVAKHFTAVKNVPTTLTKDVHSDSLTQGLLTQSLPGYQSFGGFYNVPSYNIPSYTPSVYTNFQPGYNAFQTAYSGWSNYPSTLDHQVQQPLTSQFTLPSYSYSHTAQLPQTYQLPQTLTHLVEQVQPLQNVHSVSPVKTVQSYTPVETLTHSVQPVHTSSVSTVTPVQRVQSVEVLPPVKQSYTPVETVSHSVQPAHTSSVETVTPVQKVHSVEVLPSVKQSYTPVETVSHSVQPVHTSSVETVTPVQRVQSVEVLPSVKTEHTVHSGQVQKGPISDFFQNLSQNFPSLPSFPTLPSFPSLPDLPSFPSTPAPAEEPVSEVKGFTADKESITVENPLVSDSLKGTVVQHVTPANEYVQPTAANGGYVY
nr:PREDICTED: mucin-3A-like [Megachile rotundata]